MEPLFRVIPFERKPQFHSRMPVRLDGRIISDTAVADHVDPLCRNAAFKQFAHNEIGSCNAQRVIDVGRARLRCQPPLRRTPPARISLPLVPVRRD